MSELRAGGLVFDSLRQKVCVPIVSRDEEGILRAASELAADPFADVVEWRADFFSEAEAVSECLALCGKVRDALSGKPLIFTFRTKAEGGEREAGQEAYIRLLYAVAGAGVCELLDIESRVGEKAFLEVKKAAGFSGTALIASRHYFQGTPQSEEMILRLLEMKEMGADIAKLAVMPSDLLDTTRLLFATAFVKKGFPDYPLVTMAMGKDGVHSRLAGGLFGSVMSFGCRGEASAPGQVEEAKLAAALDALADCIE